MNEALETSEAYKIVILRSTRLNLNALNRKLYLDIKKGLKLKNKSVDPYTNLCKRILSLFLPNLLTPFGNFRSLHILFYMHLKFLDLHFTILKLGSLNRKLYVDLKMVSILKIRLETSL